MIGLIARLFGGRVAIVAKNTGEVDHAIGAECDAVGVKAIVGHMTESEHERLRDSAGIGVNW